MNKNIFLRIWHAVRWPLGVLVLLYVGLVVYRIYYFIELDKTNATVAEIHAKKITLDDVWAKNLPHIPDATISSTTIAGVDENQNGVRDDVEIAILNNHHDSAKVRLAQMQYAKAIQDVLVNVYNSETLNAALQERNRALGCLYDTLPETDFPITQEESTKQYDIVDGLEKEVLALVLNTDARQKRESYLIDKYMSSGAELQGASCDIDLKQLPN